MPWRPGRSGHRCRCQAAPRWKNLKSSAGRRRLAGPDNRLNSARSMFNSRQRTRATPRVRSTGLPEAPANPDVQSTLAAKQRPGWPFYSAATLLDFCAARSRSSTVRQPALRLERCLTMHAVIFGMFGISELQRRNASLVHIDCASALKAKLEVDEIAEIETANATMR